MARFERRFFALSHFRGFPHRAYVRPSTLTGIAIPLAAARGRKDVDADLVRRAQSGDRWAEEALYRRHVDDVMRIARRVLGRSADADDVVQEAFVIALSRLGTLRDGASFGGWLGRIALNLVRTRLRKRRMWKWVGLDSGEDDARLVALASNEIDPEQRAELARVDAALSALGAEARMAWVLRHVEGWTLDEVAGGIGVSLATAKRRLKVAEEAIETWLRESEAKS
jgi:RNA polymerase sigma-70 factor (ECF subfamily)